jgi:hypothetical protein
MAKITVDEANKVETTTALRVKFASMDIRGNTVSDANNVEEYSGFFDDLPEGWSAEPVGLIETRTEATRQAWHLSDGKNDFIAVEHETGLEVLVTPVVTGLVVKAVTTLVDWGWKRWTGRRKDVPYKEETSLVIEVPRSGSANTPPIRLVVPSPVSAEDIARYLGLAVTLGQGG